MSFVISSSEKFVFVKYSICSRGLCAVGVWVHKFGNKRQLFYFADIKCLFEFSPDEKICLYTVSF